MSSELQGSKAIFSLEREPLHCDSCPPNHHLMNPTIEQCVNGAEYEPLMRLLLIEGT